MPPITQDPCQPTHCASSKVHRPSAPREHQAGALQCPGSRLRISASEKGMRAAIDVSDSIPMVCNLSLQRWHGWQNFECGATNATKHLLGEWIPRHNSPNYGGVLYLWRDIGFRMSLCRKKLRNPAFFNRHANPAGVGHLIYGGILFVALEPV